MRKYLLHVLIISFAGRRGTGRDDKKENYNVGEKMKGR